MKKTMNSAERDAIDSAIRRAFAISSEIGERLDDLIPEDFQLLNDEEAISLLTKVVEVMKRGASRRGDSGALAQLSQDTEAIVTKVMESRRQANTATGAVRSAFSAAGGSPEERVTDERVPVSPRQVYHGRKVDLWQKTLPTKNIHLWSGNERLDVHLEQFRTLNGRQPTNEEMLSIMHGVLQLPGVGAGEEEDASDPFLIHDLANNIAKNGVRRPPIIDNDGVTLLDGNRRIAACYYILNSVDYNNEEKQQAENIVVWQLTEHADDDDRDAVIVSLNFEDECKLIWPDYVRAKKVKAEYDSMCLRVGQQQLDKKQERAIRKALAKKYALKPARLGLFLKQVEWAEKFEEYHIDEKGQDLHEVRHFAKNKFSYFKELSDIDDVLDSDTDYRALAFDLLFQGKIKNWETVRLLRHRDDQLERELRQAHAESDLVIGKRNVTLAVNGAYQRYLDKRPPVGTNEMIESFVKFLGKLPPSAYLDAATVRTDSLHSLHTLCAMALTNSEEALKARGESI